MVYTDDGSVWVYDIAAGSVHDLGVAAPEMGQGAAFRTSSTVSVPRLRVQADESHPFGQDSLVDVDVISGATTETLRLPGALSGFDWSQDGTLLAYQLRTDNSSEIGPRHLCLFDSVTGATTLLRAIERPFGTGAGQREQTLVRWSPSGAYVLAVETAAQPSMFVVDRQGRDVIPPRDGTFGTWLSDERLLFQKDPHTDFARPWVAVSIKGDRARPFGLPDIAYRPVISPSGSIIAFDDGAGDRSSVFVFDTDSGDTRRLGVGYAGAIWIGPTEIAATRVRAAGGDIPWSPMRSTTSFNVATGEGRELQLPTTLEDDLRFGDAAVWPD